MKHTFLLNRFSSKIEDLGINLKQYSNKISKTIFGILCYFQSDSFFFKRKPPVKTDKKSNFSYSDIYNNM